MQEFFLHQEQLQYENLVLNFLNNVDNSLYSKYKLEERKKQSLQDNRKIQKSKSQDSTSKMEIK